MVRGLANKDGAAIVTARGEKSFTSVGVPVSSLVELPDADAMNESLDRGEKRRV